MDRSEVIQAVVENQVEFIELQFTDIFGIMKSVSIPSEELGKALSGEIMFDGSAIDGFVRIEESDMYLRPDLDTFLILPWAEYPKEARLICDIVDSEGNDFSGCPRNTLKKAIRESADKGYTLQVGPECEFFMFHTTDTGEPSRITHDRASYFDMAPQDLGGNARKDIVRTLKDMGFSVEASHHENAPGQHEIDFRYSDALNAADSIMTFKMVVRLIAKRHGLHATFMPKPSFGVSGSGMHLNLSLSSADGTNLFYDGSDPLKMSKLAYSFMAGLLAHAREYTAVTNPTVNSYKRLVSGYEAPALISWSSRNRSPLIRVPSIIRNSTRIELRSPDSSANPYTAIAAVLAAGMDGVLKNLDPGSPLNSNLYDLSQKEIDEKGIERLPYNLYEAVNCLNESSLMKETLGDHIFEKLTEACMKEWDNYSNQITAWEIERYLQRF